MRKPDRTIRTRDRGFTLTELLVVMSLIIFMIGLAFPIISSLRSGSRIEAGLNTIGMSVDVARQWVGPSAWDADATDNVQYEQYSGTAAIYTPNGEIRIVSNNRNAQVSGNVYLEDLLTRPTPLAPNGYQDLSGVDYINIPSGVGVAGIIRDGGNTRFIAPPFAIAFDQNGQMYHGYTSTSLFGDTVGRIFYDGFAARGQASNGLYALINKRPDSYDPAEWDGANGAENQDVMSDTRPIKALPFEAIECVAGVVIYDEDDFEGLGYNFSGGGEIALTSTEGQWLQENGEVLFFSPLTGVALRGEKE